MFRALRGFGCHLTHRARCLGRGIVPVDVVVVRHIRMFLEGLQELVTSVLFLAKPTACETDGGRGRWVA